jgi:lipopolysaccharide transport system permease protein
MPDSRLETEQITSFTPLGRDPGRETSNPTSVRDTSRSTADSAIVSGAPAEVPESQQEIVIRRRQGWQLLELRELWNYRQLLAAFFLRDLKARQKQTVLGFVWLIASPLFSVAVFSVVFGRLAKIPSDDLPYPLFVFAGQVIWNAFANVVTQTTHSVVGNSHFIQKIYFPRLLIPVSAGIAGVVDTAVVFLALLATMLFFGYPPTWSALLAPFILVLVMMTGMGIGFFLAPLNVKYRDVGYLANYGIQLGMYLTPVVYSVSLVPERYRLWLALNPVAGYIDAFRWCLYGTEPNPILIVASLVATTVLFIGGAFYFVRMQGRFADII